MGWTFVVKQKQSFFFFLLVHYSGEAASDFLVLSPAPGDH